VSFCSLEGFPACPTKKKLACRFLRAICYSVIKLATTSMHLFHLPSAFRMQKGETFRVQRESWRKREQNMSDTSKDVMCLKRCCFKWTRIPLDCSDFTFWETVSALSKKCLSFIYSLNLFINPLRKLTADIRPNQNAESEYWPLC